MKNLASFKTIKQFGPFRDFDWETVKGKDGQTLHFQPLNFIFGRNYSGKTTLSKILQAFERKALPEHYDRAAFELKFDDGTVLSESQLTQFPLPVRVFNRDFVTDNLAFLRDTRSDDESIRPFAVLGAGSRQLEERIVAKAAELGVGNGVKGTGLMQRHEHAVLAYDIRQADLDAAKRELERVMSDIATGKDGGIRHDTAFGQPDYTVGMLGKDVERVLATDFTDIDDATDAMLRRLIAEKPKPFITPTPVPRLDLPELKAHGQELLSRIIMPGRALAELLDDYVRECWLRDGVELHRHDHTTCAFCGQPIPDERWLAIRRHFSEDAEALRTEIVKLIDKVKRARTLPEIDLTTRAFYEPFKARAKQLIEALWSEIRRYQFACDAHVDSLRNRECAITTPRRDEYPYEDARGLSLAYKRIARIVRQNNDYSAILAEEQDKAREKIRLHRVATAVRERGIASLSKRVKTLEYVCHELAVDCARADAAVRQAQDELAELRRQRSDASAAAELVNKYMSWLGKEEKNLSLTAVEIEEDGVRSKVFRVMRGDNQAFNLSEGECNLIAFCYFLATLSGPELQNDKPIIWIDDPISSLDSNHIYFVYAMIRGVILNEKRYAQLFVSTHNLDFFRYLRRVADWTVKPNGEEQRVPCAWFFVHGTGNGPTISPLPSYLKNYITEFSYLFSRIYDAAEADPTAADYEKLTYDFGNAARRFLEIYLYFKFPNDRIDEKTEHTTRMVSVFGDHVRAFMVDRVINEMSHEPGAFERTMQPVDSEGIHKVAQEILKAIKDKDPIQYEELIKGIGKRDPSGV